MEKISQLGKSAIFLRLLLTLLVFISIYGLNYSVYKVSKESATGNCIFMSKGSWCRMDIFTHISLWQQIFTGLLPRFISFLIFVCSALTLIVSSILVQRKNTHRPPLTDKKLITTWPVYFIQQPYLLLSDPIKQALASGILQPQIFKL